MDVVVVNPSCKQLETHVRAIPNTFEGISAVIQNKRNDIRVTGLGDVKVVIKNFKGMNFFNKIRYSLFVPSKARRSFEYSQRIIEKGFRVPQPIAYIDRFRAGFLAESFFISEYWSHTPFTPFMKNHPDPHTALREFARFTFRLHNAGIYHRDYSEGNILCNMIDGKCDFALVDLNRVEFKAVGYSEGVKTFVKLLLDLQQLEIIVDEYSCCYGIKASNQVDQILRQKKISDATRGFRKSVKDFFRST